MSCARNAVRVLLLGPNRWPKETLDLEAGLKIRKHIVEDNTDLPVEWLLMEQEPGPSDLTEKFLSLATDPRTTHVFLLWPRDAKMAGTEDELILWQAIALLRTPAPECYLFHQSGVLRIEQNRAASRVLVEDEQAKSPYLYNLLERGVFEQEWTDVEDLRHQVREVLVGDLGVRKEQPP